MSTRKAPAKKPAKPAKPATTAKPAKAKAAETVAPPPPAAAMASMGGLRTLGAPVAKKPAAAAKDAPKRTKAQSALAEQAVKTLRNEFTRALNLKQKLAAEASAGGDEKGRDANEADKLRSIVASLEGMSRFALAMNLITAAESRALWAEAMGKGLYEGWRS